MGALAHHKSSLPTNVPRAPLASNFSVRHANSPCAASSSARWRPSWDLRPRTKMLVSALTTIVFCSGARSCPHCRPHFRSTNRVSQYEQYPWADYRYGGSSIDDTRHRGQLVRVSANFRALKNTERAGHDGKATFVTLSTKCDMLPWPNHDCHGAAIDRSIDRLNCSASMPYSKHLCRGTRSRVEKLELLSW